MTHKGGFELMRAIDAPNVSTLSTRPDISYTYTRGGYAGKWTGLPGHAVCMHDHITPNAAIKCAYAMARRHKEWVAEGRLAREERLNS